MIGIVVGIVYHYSPDILKPSPPGATMNYTQNICDDAYTTEKHYDDKEIPYVDVPLHEQCFSGFVGLPRKWRSWQWQLLHNNDSNWAAMWWRGSENPLPAQWNRELNSPNEHLWLPSMDVRVEGRGTLRFYCTVGCPEPAQQSKSNVGKAEAAVPSPPRKIIPMRPTSGSNDLLELEIDECSEPSVPRIECYGYMTNRTEYLENVALYESYVVDDDGNTPHLSAQFSNAKLMPGVREKFQLMFDDSYVAVKTLNFTLNFSFHNQNLTYLFKNVPVQK